MPDPVFIIEIPYCANTQLRDWLSTNLERRSVCFVYQKNELPQLSNRRPGTAVWLPPKIAGRMGGPAMRQFSVVYGRFGTRLHPPEIKTPQYFMLVRDPVTRLRAAIADLQSRPNTRLAKALAAAQSIEHFFETHPVPAMDNIMVRRLGQASNAGFGEVDQDAFDRALEAVRSNVVVARYEAPEPARTQLAEMLKLPAVRQLDWPVLQDDSADVGFDIRPDQPWLAWDQKLYDAVTASAADQAETPAKSAQSR